MSLATRSPRHELLDGDELDGEALRANLRDMAMLNRLPGGVSTSVRAVRRLLDGVQAASVLDIGAGSGDFARRLLREAPRAPVSLVVADARDDVLAVARRNLRHTDLVTFLQADVRALPLADGSVDVAHASLLLHHLDPDDAATALGELRRVALRGVVVNDLRRSRLALLLTAAPVLAFSRSPVTRHDAILSARRAYTLDELDAAAARAGLAVAWRSSSVWPRVTTVYR